MKAVCSSKTLEYTCKSKWCYNPEDQHQHILADHLLFTQSMQKLNLNIFRIASLIKSNIKILYDRMASDASISCEKLSKMGNVVVTEYFCPFAVLLKYSTHHHQC
jgi:hypothetical protein